MVGTFQSSMKKRIGTGTFQLTMKKNASIYCSHYLKQRPLNYFQSQGEFYSLRWDPGYFQRSDPILVKINWIRQHWSYRCETAKTKNKRLTLQADGASKQAAKGIF
jgi:hypothetical protein